MYTLIVTILFTNLTIHEVDIPFDSISECRAMQPSASLLARVNFKNVQAVTTRCTTK